MTDRIEAPNSKWSRNMKSHLRFFLNCCVVIFFMSTLLRDGKADFINLDFELAQITPLPPSETVFGDVSFADAFPGWTGHFSGLFVDQPVTRATYNNLTLGLYNISIVRHPWDFSDVWPVIQGNHMAILQSGTGQTSAILKQTGRVPASATTIEIKAGHRDRDDPNFSRLRVTLGGANIQLFPAQQIADYVVFRGDISSFSGQIRELTISTNSISNISHWSTSVDQISFSNLPVPEPSSLGLCGIGCCVLSYRSRHSRKGFLR
jgi:hypothetical protein